jgi:hypothetical protein
LCWAGGTSKCYTLLNAPVVLVLQYLIDCIGVGAGAVELVFLLITRFALWSNWYRILSGLSRSRLGRFPGNVAFGNVVPGLVFPGLVVLGLVVLGLVVPGSVGVPNFPYFFKVYNNIQGYFCYSSNINPHYCTVAAGYFVTFARWQSWHSLHHSATPLASLGHK